MRIRSVGPRAVALARKVGCGTVNDVRPKSGTRTVRSLGTRPSKNRKGGSGTSAGVEVYTAEC